MTIRTLSLVFILAFSSEVFSQNQLESINSYVDSIDGLITTATGLPGEISCNTITTSRIVRAIGLQETRISFYFMQAEEIVYEDSAGVKIVPVYNPPLKILVEYNIAASQNVRISYYHDRIGNLIFRIFDSKGAYGDRYFKQWYRGSNLLAVEIFEDGKVILFNKSSEIPAEEINTSVVTRKFSDLYLDMYYDLFRFEELDK